MKKRWLICIGLVIALVLSISLGGCRDGSKTSGSSGGGSDGLAVEEENGSESNDEFDPQTETDKILYEDVEAEFGPLPEVPDGTTIGAIVSSQTNEYWVMFAEGIKDKCKELGIELDLQAAKSEDDQSGQLAQAETLVTKNYDAYLFSPMTRDAFRPLIGTAHQNGAIVINPYIEVLDDTDCYVGSLDSLTAVAAAKKTIELLGGKGKVATAQGTLASKMNYYRCGVFKEYIEANSEIEVVMEMPCEWMPEKGMQMTQDLLTTTPDLGLVWCANDGLAMGVIEGVRKADKTDTCLVLSMDGTSVALDAVKKGELQGTYFNDPHGLSGIAVEIAVRELAGQKLPKVVETPVTLIDASNVDQYLKK